MDPETIVAHIRQAYPNLHIRRIEFQEGGQFNQIVLVNQELIFRFPRYDHVMDHMDIRRAVVDRIRPLLPLPVPEILYQSPNTGVPGEVFSVYRMIPGKPLYREHLNAITAEHVRQGLAEQAAAFLKALHSIDTKQLGIHVPVEDPLEYYENFFAQVREVLLPKMRQSAQVQTVRFFERLLDYLRQNSYRPCLIHNDFGGSNILFDDSRLILTGVIDFNALCLGDPAVDIASLSTYGEDFVLRGISVYPEMETLLERARWIKGTFALEEALSGWQDGDIDAFERGMENYV
jgi:aminoglycoside 2''-phosphotransferase